MYEFLIWVGIILFFWTVCSVVWFVRVFADKGRKEKWYDKFFYPPVMLIAKIIGRLR